MKPLIIILISVFTIFAQIRVDGCIQGWTSEPSTEQLELLTHLLVFQIGPNNDGTLNREHLPSWIASVSKKSHDVGTKVIVGVGGWGLSEGFASAVLPENRGTFASNLKAFCEEFNLDGLNFDWEFPTQDQLTDYIETLKMIKDSIGERELGFAASAERDPSYFSDEFYTIVDVVELMTYDMYSGSGGHADMDVFLPAAEKWGDYASNLHAKGVNFSSKSVILGLPFYARNIANPADALTYSQIIASGGNSEVDLWESGSKKYGYNGTITIKEKTKFAIDSGYGGVMIWSLNQDLPTSDDRSLLKAINDEVGRSDVAIVPTSVSVKSGVVSQQINGYIEFTSSEIIHKVSVYSLQGEELYSLSSDNITRLSTAGFSQGIYLISLKMDGVSLLHKIKITN